MHRYRTLLLVLCGFMLVTGLGIAASAGRLHHDSVYTVADIQDHLMQDPGRWAGHTVLVRGVAQACLPSGSVARVLFCQRQPQALYDPGLAGARNALPLVWRAPRAWLSFLRGVPVLGTFLLAPQPFQWGAVATYRVQLRAVPAAACTALPCYEAVLDTARTMEGGGGAR